MGAVGPIELILILATLLLPILAIINILRSTFDGNKGILWAIIVILEPIIGSILCFMLDVRIRLHHKNAYDHAILNVHYAYFRDCIQLQHTR